MSQIDRSIDSVRACVERVLVRACVRVRFRNSFCCGEFESDCVRGGVHIFSAFCAGSHSACPRDPASWLPTVPTTTTMMVQHPVAQVLLGAVALLLAPACVAMPANPNPFNYTLYDGSNLTVRLRGNELGNLLVLEANGQVIVEVDPPDGRTGIDFKYGSVDESTGSFVFEHMHAEWPLACRRCCIELIEAGLFAQASIRVLCLPRRCDAHWTTREGCGSCEL